MRKKVQVYSTRRVQSAQITISRVTNAFACVRMRVEVRRSARVVYHVCVFASYFRALLFFVSFLASSTEKSFVF